MIYKKNSGYTTSAGLHPLVTLLSIFGIFLCFRACIFYPKYRAGNICVNIAYRLDGFFYNKNNREKLANTKKCNHTTTRRHK